MTVTQYTPQIEDTPTNVQSLAIRRPQTPVRYQEQIDKTIVKATIEGKKPNTILGFKHRLRQLTQVTDLMNPEDVKKTIGYSKLSDSSKTCFTLAYQWFCNANGLQWEKPKFKWTLKAPIIPTTDQVNKIISATTPKFATIFKLMAQIGVEGEELHQTHRNQYDNSTRCINITGLKGHGSANCKLKTEVAQMLQEYLTRHKKEYPFPRPKTMSTMWRRARTKASTNHNDKQLLTIPMKNLRNYSGAQFYYQFPDPIGVQRHLRHKRIETTMHYLRAIVLDGDPEYDCKTAKTPEEITRLIELGYTKQDEIDGIHFYRKRK